MLWTTVGLVVGAAVAFVAALTEQNSPVLKRAILCIFAAAALVVGYLSAHDQDQSSKQAQERVTDLRDRLQTQQQLLTLVNATVGDLGTLNQLSGGRKYYVLIASDTREERLEPSLKNIENQFPGAKAIGAAMIRKKAGSETYELVFGSGLNPAAAEVYQRLAMNHQLPPADKICKCNYPAFIKLEPE